MCQLHTICFEVPEKRERHTHSDTQPRTRPNEEAQTRGRRKFHLCISHMTALWIIELSWSSWSTLWCAHRESLTCQTLHYTHIHGYKLFSHVPQADGTLHGAPHFISCCFEQRGLNMFVSFRDKTEDFSGTLLILKCIICLFYSTLSICYLSRWHWWWGWMIKLCYYLCQHFILLWLADGGRCE